MCIWTVIKKVSIWVSVLCVLITLATAGATLMWWIGGNAVADYKTTARIEVLETKVEQVDKVNTEDHKVIMWKIIDLEATISEVKSDVNLVKNDTSWIVKFLKLEK